MQYRQCRPGIQCVPNIGHKSSRQGLPIELPITESGFVDVKCIKQCLQTRLHGSDNMLFTSRSICKNKKPGLIAGGVMVADVISGM